MPMQSVAYGCVSSVFLSHPAVACDSVLNRETQPRPQAPNHALFGLRLRCKSDNNRMQSGNPLCRQK